MSLRLKIIDRQRTFIMRVCSSEGETTSHHRWIAVHHRDKNWAALFTNALDLLMEEATPREHGLAFADNAGTILWRRKAFWTIIRVELNTFSRNKRRLVMGALLKAARYRNE